MESKELDDRPHEYKALASAGVKQYYFHRSVFEKSTGLVEEAGASSNHDLNPDEYTRLTDHMKGNFGVACKRKKSTPAMMKPPESPEAQAFKKAKVALGCSLKKSKSLTDKINKELDEAKVRTEAITTNGYPAELTSYYLAKIAAIQKTSNDLHEKYVTMVSRPERTDALSLNDVTAEITSTDESVVGLESTMKSFRKGTDVDIRRMATPPAD